MLRAPFALIWNLLKLLPFLLRRTLYELAELLTRRQRKYVRLKLPPRQPFGPAVGLAARFQDTPSYIELREQMTSLATDPRLEGLLVTADNLHMGPAQRADIAQLIRGFKAQNKRVVFHLHSAMGQDFDLAMEADQVLLTPGGRIYLFGPGMDQYFAAPLLQRLGVVPQFVHIGPFKTAAHRFIHAESTDALRLMMNQLLDSITTLRQQKMLRTRPLDADALDTATSMMPLNDRRAQVFGFVDHIIQRPNVRHYLSEGNAFIDTPPAASTDSSSPDSARAPRTHDSARADHKEPSRPVQIYDLSDYAERRPRYHWTSLLRGRPSIATMDLSGTIIMSGMEVPGQSGAVIDPDDVLPVLRRLGQDRQVRAIVLHINSPGGSALASELLWDGIRRLRREKPVVAYCSDVAASGGYYLAVACDKIVCQPESITGSIGVIAGKFTFPGAIEHLGINHESYRRNESALFTSLVEPLSEQILANLQDDARAFYRQFLRRVGQNRQLPRRRLHRYARGRVYIGADAHRRHLVDRLGGFDDAVKLAAELANLPPETPVNFFAHRKISLPALLRRNAVQSILPASVDELRLMKAIVDKDPLLAWLPLKFYESPPL